jgi:electron transfer flavoprotein beta subunit
MTKQKQTRILLGVYTEQNECTQDDNTLNMKILDCIKEVVDTALSLDSGLGNSVIFNEGLPRRLNPADMAALNMALGLKKSGAEITVVSIGEKRVESYLRNALAIGAAKAVRIWDEDFSDLSPAQKALLLSGLAISSGADLVFTGARSPDTGSGQVGLMIAARLGWSCVTDVTGVEITADIDNLILVKDIGKGEREKVKTTLPALVTIKGEGKLPYASIDSLIQSGSATIPVLKAADIGITRALLKSLACPARLGFPRPPLAKAPPLDSALPAFDRILQLLQGGIAGRKGRMLEGDAAQVAEQLYRILVEEGVVKKR